MGRALPVAYLHPGKLPKRFPLLGPYPNLMKKEIKLEPTLERNGRVMPRCQALSQRKGTQCTQAARRGYRVCHMHGAGTKKRVEAGERNPVGRPPIHGLYSRRTRTDIQDLSEQVYETEGALENSDRELSLLKGTLWFLANQSETFVGKVGAFEVAAEEMQSVLDNYIVVKPGRGEDDTTGCGEMTPEDARIIGKNVATCFKLVTALESWVMNLADVNTKTINAHKVRAETAGKLAETAETKALAEFGRLLQLVRTVVFDSSPSDEWLEAFEARLERELYGPLNLEMPDKDVKPEDLN